MVRTGDASPARLVNEEGRGVARTRKLAAQRERETSEAMERAVRSAGEARLSFEPQGYFDMRTGRYFNEIEVADELARLRRLVIELQTKALKREGSEANFWHKNIRGPDAYK